MSYCDVITVYCLNPINSQHRLDKIRIKIVSVKKNKLMVHHDGFCYFIW